MQIWSQDVVNKEVVSWSLDVRVVVIRGIREQEDALWIALKLQGEELR